jgi:sugar phosphate isomerase/epimerase
MPELGLGIGSLMPITLPELIDSAEAAGFHRMSVTVHSFREALANGWTVESLRQRLADAGIGVSLIEGHVTALPNRRPLDELDPAVRDRLPPDITDPPDEALCFHAAVSLGSPLIALVHVLGLPTPVHELAAALAGVCRRAAAHGLTIGIEFLPDTGIPDLPYAQAVIEAAGEPNVGLILDVRHLHRTGGTVDDVRALPPNSIVYVQLSDLKQSEPALAYGDRLMPGEGDLPLYDLVDAALENSPGVPVDIEVLSSVLAALSRREATRRIAQAGAAWRATQATAT